MIKLFASIAFLFASTLANSQAQRIGITAEALHIFDDPSMPAKDFRVLKTTYTPGGQNPRHYHVSHVVFYVLEGAGVWQEDGKPPVTLKAGENTLRFWRDSPPQYGMAIKDFTLVPVK